ncbi:putative pentatricopeptide repeat protein [Neofusicoccum parvum UCRNP2]|uniref:Putative pentatricopeptide repeat protein n=1 Tax=Botryosphaeria parva (strain UCR-NP2) TaxID=1287680 RepID=R1GL47_BOTPV|nr:putative pentatricopeptide repeat protein [Neofusicoccum parvum UCRNP2]
MAARANAASTLLERATALQVREFLRARENNLQIRCLCPRGKRHYLDKFNLYLWQARFDPKDHEIAKQLWKWYIRTQLVVPDFLRALSTKAWNILWRTQSLRTPAEPKTIVHLTRLVEDMRKAGYKASFEQRLVHIETMFGRGDRTEAILEWQEGYMTQKGRTQDSYRPEYLELGIHMYSAAGDSTRALELLLDLFAAYPEWNPKAILYVFDAHVRIYLTQGNKDKLLDLKTWQIKHAKLPTNTSAVNAEMAFHLQHGHLHDVWRTFERDIARKAKSQIATTRPDLGTFIRLWEASLIKPRHISQPAPSRFYSRHFPPPAIILRHTLSWLSSLSLKTTPAETLASLRRSRLPNLVAKTLTAWNDLPGALVAMHALYHASPTPLPPTQQTATVLARAIARLGFRARTPRQRRDVNASTALRLNQEKVLHALRFIVERRLKQQQQQQQNGEEEKSADDGEKEKAQLLLDALSELVRAALVRRGVDAPEKVEARIEGAKRAARVPADMPTGDKSAVEVAMEMGRG